MSIYVALRPIERLSSSTKLVCENSDRNLHLPNRNHVAPSTRIIYIASLVTCEIIFNVLSSLFLFSTHADSIRHSIRLFTEFESSGIYGMSSSPFQSAFKRPKERDKTKDLGATSHLSISLPTRPLDPEGRPPVKERGKVRSIR